MGNLNVEGMGHAREIEKIMEMLELAYSSDNNSEVEILSRKILELDNKNSRAWFLLGEVVGWKSTLANIRLKETVNYFKLALENTSPIEMDKYVDDIMNTMENLSYSLIKLSLNHFVDFPSNDNGDKVINVYARILESITEMVLVTKKIPDEIIMGISNVISNKLLDASLAYTKTFKGRDDKPSDYDLERYIERMSPLINLEDKNISMVKTHKTANVITKYNNLIGMQEKLINAQSWERTWNDFWLEYRWTVSMNLSETNIANRRKQISSYREEISKINKFLDDEKKAKEKKIFDEYWEKNPEEKKWLDDLKKQQSAVNSEISSLQRERSSLGLFKFKEKKEIDFKIELKTKERNNLISEQNKIINKIKRG